MELNRVKIEEIVKQFFLEKEYRPFYFRSIEEIEDPYSLLEEDLLYDRDGRVHFFHYIEKTFNFECEDEFVWKAKRLSQVYDYIERRLIKEPNKPYKPTDRQILKQMSEAKSSSTFYAGGKIAFLFPGQGAQKVGMCVEVVKTVKEAKELFDKASEILGYDLLQICLEGKDSLMGYVLTYLGPEEKLESTEISQVAIYVASFAALAKLKSSEDGDAVKNCLGEYTALVFAGVLNFEDGLKLVNERAKAMQQAIKPSTGMLSVLALELSQLQQLINETNNQSKGKVEIANILCPGNIVVSGDEEGIQYIINKCNSMDPKRITKRLRVAGAFHSSFMKPALQQLQQVISQTNFQKPRIPVIANINGKPYESIEDIKEGLLKQLTSPVQWEESINYILNAEYAKLYEIGPGVVLSRLVRHVQKNRSGTPAQLINITV